MSKSTLHIVGEGAAWTTGANILVKLFSLINVFLIVNHLSIYSYGLINLVLSVTGVLSAFLLPGLSSVLIADMSRERGVGRADNAYALARQYISLQLCLGFIAFALIIVLSHPIANYLLRPEIGYYLSIAAFSFLIDPVRGFISLLANVELRFLFQAVLSILDEGIKLAFLLLFFFVFHFSIIGVLFSLIFTPITVLILTTPWWLRSIKQLLAAPRSFDPWWGLVTGHRFWGIATSYLANLNQNTRLWFIQFFLGTEAVGLFSFAQGLVNQGGSLLNFGRIVNPLLAYSAHTTSRLAMLGERALKYHVWITVVTLVPAMFITPFFIKFFFPKYVGATVVTIVYLISLLPSIANIAISAIYPALQLQKEYFFRATLLRSVTIILFSPILIASFGLLGAIYEILITTTVSSFERLRGIRRHLPGFLNHPKNMFVFDSTDRALIRHSLSFFFIKDRKFKTTSKH